MKPVQIEELSGLLDGELPEQRAAEVRAAIAADSQLRAEFVTLTRMHGQWMSAAASAAFEPRLAPRSPMPALASHWLIGIVSILLVRFVPKFTAAWPGLAIQITALAFVVWFVLLLLKAGLPSRIEGESGPMRGLPRG